MYFGHSSIPPQDANKHKVSESRSISVFRWKGELKKLF
jgi:hypothetical protein